MRGVTAHAVGNGKRFNEAEARAPRMRGNDDLSRAWHLRFNEAEARAPRMQ